MDAYCQTFLNLPYDKNGDLAKNGKVQSSSIKKNAESSLLQKNGIQSLLAKKYLISNLFQKSY